MEQRKRRTQAEMQADAQAERAAMKAELRREILAEQAQKIKKRHKISAENMQELLYGR
jgi:hypothetical protein